MNFSHKRIMHFAVRLVLTAITIQSAQNGITQQNALSTMLDQMYRDTRLHSLAM